jgi:type III restriction enzyme
MDSIVRHILTAVTEQNRTSLEPVFDEESPIGATGWMRPWFTSKPTQQTTKSHISHAVIDSTWEFYTVTALEKHEEVEAYAKNDHLGFQIHYIWQGSRRRYVPDFIIRLRNGTMLALEIKGQDSEQNRAKRQALAEWVAAINATGGFGTWACDVAYAPEKVHDILVAHQASGADAPCANRPEPVAT